MSFNQDTNYKIIIQSTRWRRLRNHYLQEHPLCEECGKLAQVVHHKIPLDKFRNDPNMMENLAFDEDNLEALCFDCHQIIHRNLGKHNHRKQDILDLTEERINNFNKKYF